MTIGVKLGSLASGAVGFFTGPFGKIGMYALIAGGVLWAGRLWLNAHDDKIFQQGRVGAIQTLTKQYEAEFSKRLAVIEVEKKGAIEGRAKAEARLDQITLLFDQAFTRLRDIKKAVEERQVIYVKQAADVPSSELDPALRAISNDIQSGPPPH